MLAAFINRKPLLALGVVLLAFVLLSVRANQQRYHGEYWRVIAASDPQWYYAYLPATFIYGFEAHPRELRELKFRTAEGTNLVFLRYTCGVAMMEMPLFLVGHIIATIGDLEPDGYTNVYGISVLASGLLYALLGLILLFKILCRSFPPWIALLTICCVFLGTNLGYYASAEPGMSHAFSFFLFAAFAFLTPRVLKSPGWKNIALMSAVVGLVTLIRPTNLMLVLYLLGYGVYSFADLKTRLRNLIGLLKYLPLAFGVIVIIMLPQMLYWHAITGDWVHWSYGTEGFDYWKAPKMLLVLFDVQNGLFVYAPIMLLAIVGLIWAAAKKRFSAPVQLVLFLLATYTFGSWWAWWFGGAFGHRSYVEFFALLAIPLAFVIQKITTTKRWYVNYASYAFLICCMYYTTGLAQAYNPPWDGPAWTWEVFYEVGIKQLF